MSQINDAIEVILTSESTGETWSAAVWDPRNSSLLSIYKTIGALSYRSLHLLSDSYILGADSTKPFIHLWALNRPSSLPVIRLPTSGKVNALTCTPNGSYIIAAVGEKLFIWQSCNCQLLTSLTKHYQTVNCLSTTKDGSMFASGGEDALVFVWSLYSALNNECCSPIHTFSDHNLPVKDLHLGHGGARARLYTVSLDRTANIYELSSGILLVSLTFDVPLTTVTVSIRESELFVGCITGDILQCNLHNPPRGIDHHVKANSSNEAEEKAIFKAHKSSVTALSVSMDCCTLLSGSTDGAVHIWDIASQLVIRTIQHKGPVTAAFFAPGFKNFRATTSKPLLKTCILQRTSDDSDTEKVIEIVLKGRNPKEILDFESYVQDSVHARQLDEAPKKLEEMKEEIEKLKKINAAMYQYSITHILNKTDDNR